MTLASIKAWLKQPSTIHGLGVAFGTVAGLVAQALTHDTTWSVAAGGSAYALMHVVLPDNSGAQSSIEKLVTDTVTAAAQKRLAEALPSLVQEGLAVVSAFKAPTTVAGGGAGPVNS